MDNLRYAFDTHSNFVNDMKTSEPTGNNLLARMQQQSFVSSKSVSSPMDNLRYAFDTHSNFVNDMKTSEEQARIQAMVDEAFRVDDDSNENQRVSSKSTSSSSSTVIPYDKIDINGLGQNTRNDVIINVNKDTKDLSDMNSDSPSASAKKTLRIYPRRMSSKPAQKVEHSVAASGVGSGSYALERALFNRRLTQMNQQAGLSDTNKNERETLYYAAKQINDELQSNASEERKAELVLLLTRFFAEDETRRLFPNLP
jgi:hypothetical protein